MITHTLRNKVAELQKKLAQMGNPTLGQRDLLSKRYERYAEEDLEATAEEEQSIAPLESAVGTEEESGGQGPHASERPMMVMVDESTGNKYL